MTPRSEGASGTEPRPTIGIGHLTILRGNEFSLLCWPGGDFDSNTDPSVGVYRRDMRYISRLTLECCDSELIQLDSHERGFALYSTLTNSATVDSRGTDIPGQTLIVRRERVLHDGFAERLTIGNFGHATVCLDVNINFACDFEDIFVIRGVHRRAAPPPVRVEIHGNRARCAYSGLDGVSRSTTFTFDPPPAKLGEWVATYHLELAPGQSSLLSFQVAFDGESSPSGAEAALAAATEARSEFVKGWSWIESSSPALNGLFERAISDLASLATERDGRRYLAAGVPWFDTLFGRDSLITGIALLGFQSDVLKDALLLLADSQATTTSALSDEEPGKIAHELRVGELANIGEVPFGRYYGSVDATPLFVWACREYLRWTGDEATLHALEAPLRAALEWCERRREASPIGALTYWRQSANGLEHQGWKDSEDAIPTPGGRAVQGPIALIEVQGYLAAAFGAAHELSPLFETPLPGAGEAHSLISMLSNGFFPDGKPALALDGAGEPLDAIASNAGHLLWTGSCSAANARSVAETMFTPGLFSGWGIRTLSTENAAFNPLGYHTGSVWPHDNAIILAGLRRYGFVDSVRTLGSALTEAMLGFSDHRVPELFSGDARGDRLFPTPYPVASRPQAWSAASLPWLLVSMAGVTAEDSNTLHVVRPALPSGLDWLRIRNIRFGTSTVDLMLRRVGDHVGVEVERQRGPGSVVLSARWPIAPLR